MWTSGLVDLQVNGYAGVDFNSPEVTPDALDHALHAMLRAGVTLCLPTLITAAESELAARLTALDRAVRLSRLGPVMVAGIPLEGPFLNPTRGYAGCHPAAAMVPPDSRLLERITAGIATPIRLLTLAPELPDTIPLIGWAFSKGWSWLWATARRTTRQSPKRRRRGFASAPIWATGCHSHSRNSSIP